MSSPPLTKTPNSQLTAEQRLEKKKKKDWNLPKKLLYKEGAKKDIRRGAFMI